MGYMVYALISRRSNKINHFVVLTVNLFFKSENCEIKRNVTKLVCFLFVTNCLMKILHKTVQIPQPSQNKISFNLPVI